MKAYIRTEEWYPVYRVLTEDEGEVAREHEVDEATLARWREVQAVFAATQSEMREVVDPSCPECGHSQFRHQEYSEGWDYWGCLASGCRCQHGIPEERRAALDSA